MKKIIIAFVAVISLCVWYSGVVEALVYNLSIRPNQEINSETKTVGDSRRHTVYMSTTSRPNNALGLRLQKSTLFGTWATQSTQSKIGSNGELIHFGTSLFSSGKYRIQYFTNTSVTKQGDYDGTTEHLAW